MPRRLITFDPGQHFHIYNRGVNRGKIFFDDPNYLFLLFNVERYLLPLMDLVAYCLMPTHYHLLIYIKETSEVETTSEVSKAMMKLSVSYTKSINHRYDRVGPLFQGAFQAKRIDTNTYLGQLIDYIHMNPVEADLVSSPEDWYYSSFYAYEGARYVDNVDLKPINDLRGRLDLGGLPSLSPGSFIIKKINPHEGDNNDQD